MRAGETAKMFPQAPVLPIPPRTNRGHKRHEPNRRRPTAQHRTLSRSRANSRCCVVRPFPLSLTISSSLAEQVRDFTEEQTASKEVVTGGKPPLTQWVHGEFIVVSESKCLALAHQVHFGHFCNVLCNSPCKNPVGTGWFLL